MKYDGRFNFNSIVIMAALAMLLAAVIEPTQKARVTAVIFLLLLALVYFGQMVRRDIYK